MAYSSLTFIIISENFYFNFRVPDPNCLLIRIMNNPVDNGFADCSIAFIPYPAVPTNRSELCAENNSSFYTACFNDLQQFPGLFTGSKTHPVSNRLRSSRYQFIIISENFYFNFRVPDPNACFNYEVNSLSNNCLNGIANCWCTNRFIRQGNEGWNNLCIAYINP